MWIFGYGSLIWKIDFPYEYKIIGHIKGFDRRFYQKSTVHRGTPESPGRVVTLLPSNKHDAKVWGMAFKIKSEDTPEVVNHLDQREKGGYERIEKMFFPDRSQDFEPFSITIYVGSPGNFNYAGEADIETIALQIFNSTGPSGTNIEYVCNLANAMRQIAPNVPDEHLYGLEAKVLELMKNKPSEECK